MSKEALTTFGPAGLIAIGCIAAAAAGVLAEVWLAVVVVCAVLALMYWLGRRGL